MMKLRVSFLLLVGGLAIFAGSLSACKQCNKKADNAALPYDTTAVSLRPENSVEAPRADTAVIPVLAEVLDKVFEASVKKDYNALGNLLVYRGPDQNRLGVEVHSLKNSYDKTIVRITGETFAKWKKTSTAIEYGRVFEMPQAGGSAMLVLEVLFVGDKSLNRKFFGFVIIGEEFKIIDVTSYL